MRQENETATSFNKLREITQAIQAQKTSAQTSENASTSENANASEIASQSTQTPKTRVHAKKGVLKPTKRAFSERQKTAFRDHSQASAKKSQETKQGDKQGDNANAFKGEQGLNSNLRAKLSAKALKKGLKNNQSNQKGGKNEA
ncbi:hypothetical protein EC503_06865 [Helicobacter pylori]|uniref:hypothetical protein n=1 Tax=Helicobacter pylori TaxID=210 RepID=UPI000FDCE54A|nr:hypothetical protein [Helicobacter pylori]RVY89791.1 hypothetical protein EC503_06865 [Helicobacter pylori]